MAKRIERILSNEILGKIETLIGNSATIILKNGLTYIGLILKPNLEVKNSLILKVNSNSYLHFDFDKIQEIQLVKVSNW
jgi:hypothetical protein